MHVDNPVAVKADLNRLGKVRSNPSPLLVAAALLKRTLPRGRGAIPHLLGKLYRGSFVDVLQTRAGATLTVEPGSLETYADILNDGGTWNRAVFETCASLLPDGGVFYDLGANVGYMTIEMAQRKTAARVVAFEPQTQLARAVALSAAINGFEHVTVFELMIGATEGEQDLYLTAYSIHASSIPRSESWTRTRKRRETIDRLVGSGTIPGPDVVKIDIEGGELDALKGAASTIRTHKPHIVFEADENMERFGYTHDDILRLLASLGNYRFYAIGVEGHLAELTKSDCAYGDFLAKSLDR
jgi:FkbM family methyltransferase